MKTQEQIVLEALTEVEGMGYTSQELANSVGDRTGLQSPPRESMRRAIFNLRNRGYVIDTVPTTIGGRSVLEYQYTGA